MNVLKKIYNSVFRGSGRSDSATVGCYSSPEVIFNTLGDGKYSAKFYCKFPAMYRAATLIARSVASLDFYVRGDDGRVFPKSRPDNAQVSQVIDILMGQKDYELSTYLLWEQIVLDLIFCGNAFLVKGYLLNGALISLKLAQSWGASSSYTPDYQLYLTHDGAGYNYRNYPKEDVVHFRAPRIERNEQTQYHYWGTSPAYLAAKSVLTGIYGDQYVQQFFVSGYQPQLAFTTMGIVTPKQKEMFDEGLRKTMKRQTPPLLSKGITPIPIPSSPQTQQVRELREYQTSEVSRFFGIPLELMSTTARPEKVEESSRLFYRWSLKHWIDSIAAQVTHSLLPAGYRFGFDTTSLVRGDTDATIKLVQAIMGAGQISPVGTVNEAREILGLDKRPGEKYSEIPDATIVQAGQRT